ncbi:MAG: TetR/AcrR family transcriptional regulator [Acidobacteriota bacterium]
MPATKRDPEATRTAILDAAEAVFVEKGFADSATSVIAKNAKVTKSLIHHHFGSKEALWTEVKARRFSRYAEQQLEMIASSGPSAQLLEQSLELYFRFLQDNPELVRLMLWMHLERDQASGAQFQEMSQSGVRAIEASQEAGELRADISADSILFVFLAVSEHWFQARDPYLRSLCCEPAGTADDDRYLADVLKIFFEGVVPRPPA